MCVCVCVCVCFEYEDKSTVYFSNYERMRVCDLWDSAPPEGKGGITQLNDEILR